MIKELVRLHFQHCIRVAFSSPERAHYQPPFPPTSAEGLKVGDSLTLGKAPRTFPYVDQYDKVYQSYCISPNFMV